MGTAGGEYGIRGFLAAYDARSGKRSGVQPIPDPVSGKRNLGVIPGNAEAGRCG